MVELKLTRIEDTHVRTVVDGKAVTVTTSVVIAEPSELAWEDVVALIGARAKEVQGEWEIVDDPLLGDVVAETFDRLVDEVASWLNEQGVSIVCLDTPLFRLGEGLL